MIITMFLFFQFSSLADFDCHSIIQKELRSRGLTSRYAANKLKYNDPKIDFSLIAEDNQITTTTGFDFPGDKVGVENITLKFSAGCEVKQLSIKIFIENDRFEKTFSVADCPKVFGKDKPQSNAQRLFNVAQKRLCSRYKSPADDDSQLIKTRSL